jgi:hypothetical protein
MSHSGARKVFPIVDRIIRGKGKLQMTATVQLQDGRWVCRCCRVNNASGL